MSVAITIVDHWSDTKRIHVCGILTLTGNYTTGGDTVNFAAVPQIKAGSGPIVFSATGSGGYNYNGIPGGPTQIPASAKLQILSDSTGSELTAAAYPAGVTNNPANFYAIFPKFI